MSEPQMPQMAQIPQIEIKKCLISDISVISVIRGSDSFFLLFRSSFFSHLHNIYFLNDPCFYSRCFAFKGCRLFCRDLSGLYEDMRLFRERIDELEALYDR